MFIVVTIFLFEYMAEVGNLTVNWLLTILVKNILFYNLFHFTESSLRKVFIIVR